MSRLNLWAATCGARKGTSTCIHPIGHGGPHADSRTTWR